MPINVDKNRCPQNHVCPALQVCQVKALSQKDFNAPTVDKEKCQECGICVNFCPMGALQIK